MVIDSLWGAEFNVSDDVKKTKKILKKLQMTDMEEKFQNLHMAL